MSTFNWNNLEECKLSRQQSLVKIVIDDALSSKQRSEKLICMPAMTYLFKHIDDIVDYVIIQADKVDSDEITQIRKQIIKEIKDLTHGKKVSQLILDKGLFLPKDEDRVGGAISLIVASNMLSSAETSDKKSYILSDKELEKICSIMYDVTCLYEKAISSVSVPESRRYKVEGDLDVVSAIIYKKPFIEEERFTGLPIIEFQE